MFLVRHVRAVDTRTNIISYLSYIWVHYHVFSDFPKRKERMLLEKQFLFLRDGEARMKMSVLLFLRVYPSCTCVIASHKRRCDVMTLCGHHMLAAHNYRKHSENLDDRYGETVQT